MKNVLGIIFGVLFLLSILISTSDNLKNKITTLSGNYKYASTIVPVPNNIEMNNLAIDQERNKN